MRPRRKPPANAEGLPSRRPKTPEQQRDDLLAYAFRALGQRALTEHELRGKLERRSDNPDLITEVLRRVQELGYQQDVQVARMETSRRGVGQFRVRQTLKRRGLDNELIEETMQAIDPDEEYAAATELLSRRWPGLARKRDPRASAYALLARRGFPGNVIWAAIREVSAASETGELTEPETDD